MQSILTVTVAADSFDLTTTQMVKTELGLTNGTNDAWIDSKIPRASSAIANYCHRTLAQQTYSEQFRLGNGTLSLSNGLEMLVLSQFPVTSIISVTEDGVLVASTDYEVAATGILYRLTDDGDRTPWTASKVTVVYVAGYVLPSMAATPRTLPPDIEDAALTFMRLAYFSRKRDPSLKSEDVIGVASATYWIASPNDESGALPPEVSSLLDPYRGVTAI